MTWKDAVVYVLQNNIIGEKHSPMHYRDITDVIVSNNLVSSSGQTPAKTVSNILTTTKSLFLRVADGEYSLTTDGQKYVVKHASKYKSIRPNQ